MFTFGLTPSAIDLIVPLLGIFGVKLLAKVDMPLNKETKTYDKFIFSIEHCTELNKAYEVHTISFQIFFVWAFEIVVDS